MDETKAISLYYRDAISDKVYHVQLVVHGDGYAVNFQFGRRGGTLQSGSKTPEPVTYVEACKVYNRLVTEKTGKGYVVSGAAQAAPIRPGSSQPAPIPQPELLKELSSATDMARLLSSDRYWLQEKRDGHRRLIVKNGSLTGYSRTGRTVEIPAALHAELLRVPLHSFILDGEAEGDRLVAFDLLEADGDLRQLDYESRFQRLQKVLRQTEYVFPVATWERHQQKIDALKDLVKARAEGVVLKDISAPYAPGRSHHFKFKFVKSLSAIVLRQRDGGKESIAVGVRRLTGELLDVGTCSVYGRTMPAIGDVVEVKYLYATAANRLYQPVFMGVRDDICADACTFDQLQFKREVAE